MGGRERERKTDGEREREKNLREREKEIPQKRIWWVYIRKCAPLKSQRCSGGDKGRGTNIERGCKLPDPSMCPMDRWEDGRTGGWRCKHTGNAKKNQPNQQGNRDFVQPEALLRLNPVC